MRLPGAPVTLKTKYAYHALLWLLDPDLVLDVGSMDGADSKRFRRVLPRAGIVAFEGNPHNHAAMVADPGIAGSGIRVVNTLVSDSEGESGFFVQRPQAGSEKFNRGVSSLTRREQAGAMVEEVRLPTVRLDAFLFREYPAAARIALWIDVEGHAFSAMEGLRGVRERVKLVHVEVERMAIWPGQKTEAEVLALAQDMGLMAIAQSAGAVQHDLILVEHDWYAARRPSVDAMLQLCGLSGPAVSRVLGWIAGCRAMLQ